MPSQYVSYEMTSWLISLGLLSIAYASFTAVDTLNNYTPSPINPPKLTRQTASYSVPLKVQNHAYSAYLLYTVYPTYTSYPFNDLNKTAPHLVKLTHSIVDYIDHYYDRDVAVLNNPVVSYVVETFLRNEFNAFFSEYDRFVNDNLSVEFNIVHDALKRYLKTDTSVLFRDMGKILDGLESFVDNELPFHLNRYFTILKYHYNRHASVELKKVVNDVYNYYRKHFVNEMEELRLQSVLKFTTQQSTTQTNTQQSTTQHNTQQSTTQTNTYHPICSLYPVKYVRQSNITNTTNNSA